MNVFLKFFSILLFLFICYNSYSSELTYGEAAYVIVHHSKLFNKSDLKNYDYDIETINTINNKSAIFLKNLGIDFDPLYVSLKRVFKLNDAYKILGQIYLLHSLDINYYGGEINLPENYTNWNEFCVMHSLDAKKFHNTIYQSFKLIIKRRN